MGRPKKYHTEEEKKAARKAYRQTPEYKAKKAAYRKTPRAKQLKNASKQRYRNTPIGSAKHRGYTLKSQYGITNEQYDELLIKQGNVCAICKKVCVTGRRLAVDHCHDTGKVRGLLCRNCNVGIGHFNDDKELLANAIKYLA